MFARNIQRRCRLFQPQYQKKNIGTSRKQQPRDSLLPVNIEYAAARLGGFTQAEPHHENPFSSDAFLQSYLRRIIPQDLFDSLEPDLTSFGHECATTYQALSQECEANPPYLVQSTAWGRRVDQIVTCRAWKLQKEIVAREGLVAIPYERMQGEYRRLYQLSKLYMYSPVSGLYWCPLAMTDAAASTITTHNIPCQDH